MELEIMPDHVHILMEVDPQLGIHKAGQIGYSESASLLPHNLIATIVAYQQELELLLIQVSPTHYLCLSGIEVGDFLDEVKSLKGYTSKVLRSEYPSLKTRMPSLWTNSYFVSTVGGAPLDVIKQ